MTNLRYNVSSSQRLILFLCTTLFCFILASFAQLLILSKTTPATLRIAMVVQDLLMFILPAIVVAIIITRQPADFLLLRRGASMSAIVMIFAVLVVSAPLMNMIIAANKAMQLPESLHGIEQWMLQSERHADELMKLVVDPSSVAAMIIAILIVGVLAGFAEELFFRGTMQRLFISIKMNPHVAIWLTAFLFSAFHLQFYGFIPRMLLGALFGYLAWWSGSIWLAVAAHIINNTMALILMWMSANNPNAGEIENFGSSITVSNILFALAGTFIAAVILTNIYKTTKLRH